MPGLCHIPFLTVLKWRTLQMLNGHTETRIVLVTIRHTHVDIVGISGVPSCFAIVIASKSPVWKIFQFFFDR